MLIDDIPVVEEGKRKRKKPLSPLGTLSSTGNRSRISVVIRADLSICTATIDKSTIWYGSVNILGFHSVDDNLIKFKTPEIATNLLDSIRRE